MQEVSKGVAYLGVVVKSYRRYMLEKIRRRIFRSLDDLYAQAIQQSPLSKKEFQLFQASVNSNLGCLKHYKGIRLISKTIDISM